MVNKHLYKIGVLLICLSCALSLRAEDDLKAKTRDALIDKLQHVYLNLAQQDATRAPLSLRLADLYAERARQNSMKELELGCVDCTAGQKDREKALKLYSEVVEKLPAESQGRVLSQVGHLYEMQGMSDRAQDVYKKILQQQPSMELKAEANLSLAEMYFKKGRFADATPYYKAVVENPKSQARGLAHYRLAWAAFNQGQLEEAQGLLWNQLKDTALLTRGAQGQVDTQFHEEVSRDLATFIARGSYSAEKIEELFKLSPASTRIGNITYLANEYERLGQLKPALEVFQFAAARQTSPTDKTETAIRLAKIELDLGRKPQAAVQFEQGLDLWSMGACTQTEVCSELQTRIRNLIISWTQNEKKAPSQELIQVYQTYLKNFGSDAQVWAWLGQAYQNTKNYSQAIDAYTSSVAIKIDESVLLLAIESAELSQKRELLQQAYNLYESKSLDKKKISEVKYQKAKLVYDSGSYLDSAQQFNALALSVGIDIKIKRQAADLSLDALVLAKGQEELIKKWTVQYGASLPEGKEDFKSVYRKTIINRVADLASTDGESAWLELVQFPVSEATESEKVIYWKNRLVLAEKSKRLSEAREAADQLLNLKGLSAQDEQLALSRKAWLSELVLDFNGALVATKKLKLNDAELDSQLLKMALYASLASQDARPHYADYIRLGKDESKKIAVAAKLVLQSEKPLAEFEKQKTFLAKNKEILAEVGLKVYAKTNDYNFLKALNSNKEVKASAWATMIARQVFMAEWKTATNKFATLTIDAKNQKTLGATIKARIKALELLDQTAQAALESGDWTSQVLLLKVVSDENQRFYNELMSLPTPAGFTAEQEQEYLGLLMQQAAPHQTKSADITAKVETLWQQISGGESLKLAYLKAPSELADLVKFELTALEIVAPPARKSVVADIKLSLEQSINSKSSIGSGQNLVSMQTLEKARGDVRSNPFNRGFIEGLLKLEKQAGRGDMVEYLESRLATMDGVEAVK
jgi:tetratricopeptide (TPR) repeat protein